MQDLINALPQYEFVFIDSPPLPPDNITNLWWKDPDRKEKKMTLQEKDDTTGEKDDSTGEKDDTTGEKDEEKKMTHYRRKR